ncbi:MAG: ribulose-phosphate 3-epimerase [Candidatus Caldatribacteriaceae bacterium]
MKKVFISASLACADFGNLERTICELEERGISFLHFDIVDGSFAPTFIMGSPILKSLRKYTSVPFEAHLACFKPEKFVEQFVEAGADFIAFHIEAAEEPEDLADYIRSLGARPVVALSPETSEKAISDALLQRVDMVLVLTVYPGFAGQPFILDTITKIEALFRRITLLGLSCLIEADGNINEATIPSVVRVGAQVLIGGTSGLFRKDRSIKESLMIMKRQAEVIWQERWKYE